MGTHYCNICGGPLSSWHLRRASLADETDDINRCYDDACDCGGDLDADPEDSEAEGGEPYHADYCSSRNGYNSSTLLQNDVQWLDRVRMLGLQEKTASGARVSVCLSKIGQYNAGEGLYFAGAGDSHMPPNRNSFLVHDSCFAMLFVVCKTSGPLYPQLTTQHLFLTMQMFSRQSVGKVINWNDPRAYGDSVSDFQDLQRWEAQHGHEWLVADPTRPIDFFSVIHYASRDDVVRAKSPIWGPVEARPRPKDCFHNIPLEIRHKIFELLPSSSVLSLSIASPSFHSASRHLPNSFWKSRLQHHYRWLNGTTLYQTLSTVRGPVNYFVLLHLLHEASAPAPGGDFSVLGQPIWFRFRNLRRIWNCCEAIRERVFFYFSSHFDPAVTPLMRSSAITNGTVRVTFDNAENQLALIRAFYPFGEKRQLGGLLFVFSDGTQQLVGRAVTRGYLQNTVAHVVGFDVASRETIVGLVCYFDGFSSRLHGVQFITSESRTLDLGFVNPRGEHHWQKTSVGVGEREVGLCVKVKAPVIKDIGFGVAFATT